MDESSLRALIGGFEDGTLPRAAWNHRAHLSVAAWYVSMHDEAEATCRVVDGIRAYNRANGIRQTRTGGYHHTITIFWLARVRSVLRGFEGSSLEAVNRVLAELGDRGELIFSYYSRDLLFSWPARLGWVDPDLADVP